jgi:hypothetical protein
MADKYDLEKMLKEIKEDEEIDFGEKKVKVSQKDIQRIIAEKRKKRLNNRKS